MHDKTRWSKKGGRVKAVCAARGRDRSVCIAFHGAPLSVHRFNGKCKFLWGDIICTRAADLSNCLRSPLC